MAAIKDAWEKTRSGAGKALSAPRSGLSKAGGGIARTSKWAWEPVGRASRKVKMTTTRAFDGPRERIAGVADSARDRPRYAIAIAAGALITLAWIAWAVYVTTDNGSTAGLGVLISWPVLLAALGLVAAPFLGTWLLVQRLRSGDEDSPPIAGGSNGDDSEETEDSSGDDDAPEDDSSEDADSSDEDSS